MLEQDLEFMYSIWESSIQFIRNNSDMDRFQRFFDDTERVFDYEFNIKEQRLAAYRAKYNKELSEISERVKSLQNQNFESSATKQLAIEQHQKLDFIRIRFNNIRQAEIKLSTIYDKYCQKVNETVDRLQNIFMNLPELQQNEVQQQGLSPRMIRSFKLFTADETHVGDQCSICMEDVDVGRIMRRLTCDGQHYFCQECIEGWFAEHNTCPLCRHVFN